MRFTPNIQFSTTTWNCQRNMQFSEHKLSLLGIIMYVQHYMFELYGEFISYLNNIKNIFWVYLKIHIKQINYKRNCRNKNVTISFSLQIKYYAFRTNQIMKSIFSLLWNEMNTQVHRQIYIYIALNAFLSLTSNI